MKTILLIDDTQEQLEGLAVALRELVGAEEATVLTWQPKQEDAHDPLKTLETLLDANDIAFVVTD